MLDTFTIMQFGLITGITPGPNNLMILNASLNFGLKRSFRHYCGICLGFPSMLFIVSYGAGALFSTSYLLHQLIKYLGCSYMLFLAYKIAKAGQQQSTAKTSKLTQAPLGFWQAFFFQWVNPKAWFSVTSAAAIFLPPNSHSLLLTLHFTALFFICCLVCASTWYFLGYSMSKLLQSPQHKRWFSYTMSVLLLGVILQILID